MLIAFLGENKVKFVDSGVNPDIDCYCDSEPLSIKTISLSGGIRMKWTSNEVKARQFIQNYKPSSNMLVVRIIWNDVGSIRFIPLDIQQHIFEHLGVEQYLDYRGTTNTRGVNLSLIAEQAFNHSQECISLPVSWQKSKATINPISKWVDYWKTKNNSTT